MPFLLCSKARNVMLSTGSADGRGIVGKVRATILTGPTVPTNDSTVHFRAVHHTALSHLMPPASAAAVASEQPVFPLVGLVKYIASTEPIAPITYQCHQPLCSNAHHSVTQCTWAAAGWRLWPELEDGPPGDAREQRVPGHHDAHGA
jgi:hypothetical protein